MLGEALSWLLTQSYSHEVLGLILVVVLPVQSFARYSISMTSLISFNFGCRHVSN